MRMITADDRAICPAQCSHQAKLLRGIDLERVVAARKIPAEMQSRYHVGIAAAPAFDQAAALFRKRRTRLFLELRAMIGAEPHHHFGGFSPDSSGTLTRPTRWPSSVSMMSISSPPKARVCTIRRFC